MTESRSKPALSAARATLPGAAPNLRFAVIVATVTVLIRDRLKASAEITRTGRRQAGADPCRGPRSAHQTSPRTTTSRRLLSSGLQPAGDRATSPQPCTRLLEPWSRPDPAPDATDAPTLSRKTRCARRPTCVRDAQPVDRGELGLRQRSSYE